MNCEPLVPVYDEFFIEFHFKRYLAAGARECNRYPKTLLLDNEYTSHYTVLHWLPWFKRNAARCKVEHWCIGPAPVRYNAALPGKPDCWLEATLISAEPEVGRDGGTLVNLVVDLPGYGTLYSTRSVSYPLYNIPLSSYPRHTNIIALPFAPKGEVCAHA